MFVSSAFPFTILACYIDISYPTFAFYKSKYFTDDAFLLRLGSQHVKHDKVFPQNKKTRNENEVSCILFIPW